MYVCEYVFACVCACVREERRELCIYILMYLEFMQINAYILCKAHFAPGANADNPSQNRAAIEANEAVPPHHTEKAP